MAASRYGGFEVWRLQGMAASRYGGFEVWLLRGMAASMDGGCFRLPAPGRGAAGAVGIVGGRQSSGVDIVAGGLLLEHIPARDYLDAIETHTGIVIRLLETENKFLHSHGNCDIVDV